MNWQSGGCVLGHRRAFHSRRISVKSLEFAAARLWAKHLAQKATIEALEGVSKGNLKHIAQHLDQFRKLDPSMTLEQVVSLGKQIASRSENLVGTPGGRKVFEEAAKHRWQAGQSKSGGESNRRSALCACKAVGDAQNPSSV
jgi:hypothetical protein